MPSLLKQKPIILHLLSFGAYFPCFFLYNQGLSRTLPSVQTPVFERVSGHFHIKEHYVHDVGTEELGHLEIVGSLVSQLTKGATPEEWKQLKSWEYYADNGASVFPQNAQGSPFTTASIAVTGDPLTNLYEDLAAEQKARAVYDNILKLSDNAEVNDVIKFLRQREVTHFQRFGEALERMQRKICEKNKFYMGMKTK